MIHKIDERINSKWGYEAQYDNILNTAKYNLYDDMGEYNCIFNNVYLIKDFIFLI